MYILSDIFYLIAYYLLGYRRKVVRTNLETSFPDWDRKRLRKVERQYYRYLSDLIIEGAYNLFASPASIKRRYRITNREVVDRYYEQGQTVILMSAHYGNWEYMVSSLNMQFLHHGIGVGKPLQDKLFDVFRSDSGEDFRLGDWFGGGYPDGIVSGDDVGVLHGFVIAAGGADGDGKRAVETSSPEGVEDGLEEFLAFFVVALDMFDDDVA